MGGSPRTVCSGSDGRISFPFISSFFFFLSFPFYFFFIHSYFILFFFFFSLFCCQDWEAKHLGSQVVVQKGKCSQNGGQEDAGESSSPLSVYLTCVNMVMEG